MHLGAVRERDADLGAPAPYHPALTPPAAVVEMQREHVRQFDAANMQHGAAVGNIGGDAIDRRMGLRQHDFGGSSDRDAFGLSSIDEA